MNDLVNPEKYETRQLELSTDNKKLAWGCAWGGNYPGSALNIIELNQNGSYLSDYSIPITDGVYNPDNDAIITGVEFSYDNTKVYVSIQGGTTTSPYGGLFYYDFNSTNVERLVYNDYSNTHLQKDTKGNIYAVANDGSNLGKINTQNNTFTPSALTIPVYSNGSKLDYYYFTLPDKIDFHELTATTNTTEEYCAGTFDAMATVTALGGVPPYTYLWDDPLAQTTPTATGLTTKKYHVTVTDAFNNSVTVEAEVNTRSSLFTHIGDMHIVTQQILSGFNAIDGNIRILYGASLTIDGQIEFNANKGITVYPGGTLIINNSSVLSGLTECGNNFWDGITIKNDADIVINGSFTLSRGDLILEPGAVVNLSQKTIALKDNKIIIKSSEGSLPGAKLTLNASTLTTVGTDTWKGIEVWGDEDKAQLPDIYGNYYQGFLEMKNLSLIENSLDGIELWKPADYTKTGGIIKAYNSTFRNNAKPIHALLYPKFYSAEFIKCTFEITDGYHGAATFYKHIDLNQVRGFRFTGCHFSVDPAAPNVSPYNAGIMSFNSGFTTTGYCTSQTIPCTAYENSTFDGFYSAVYASGTNSPYTFCVTNSTFTNNTCGVKVNAVNNFAVLWSDFYIGYNTADDNECDGTGLSAASYGINASASTGFAIEENYFTKADGAPAGYYTGIRVAETNATDEIYNNQFDGLSYGIYAEGKNWKEDNFRTGLSLLCNQFTGSYRDIVVEKNPITLLGGIQSSQGSAARPAGNDFVNNIGDYKIYNNGNYPILYYYDDNMATANPNPSYEVGPIATGSTNGCPSHYGGGGSGIETITLTDAEKLVVEQEYLTALNNYNSVKTLYENLQDGGDTEGLMTEVETAWPDDMWELRAELLGKSPHLSTKVLKAAADKTDVLPESMIFEIMAANPDELRNDELLKYLEDKENPLPEYLIDILRQVSFGTTYKTALQNQMAESMRLKTRAANSMIRSILNEDDLDYNLLRSWFDNLGGVKADQQVIETYLTEGNVTDASALAEMIPELYQLSGYDLDEHAYYTEMLDLRIDLLQQGRSYDELTGDEVAQLESLAQNSHSTAGATARAILEQGYGHHFCDCLNIAHNQGFKSTAINPALLNQALGVSCTADPNPAREWTAFDYTLPENTGEAVIKITDASGQLVKMVELTETRGQYLWDTREVKPGVYFYTLLVNGTGTTSKLIITK
ncbi:MAG: T9SS type A sorting domain-containing protein [Bacteroidales bacterium]|nr:T9SS type A sorting domain-containing protein [Bacteroidales bacterium]